MLCNEAGGKRVLPKSVERAYRHRHDEPGVAARAAASAAARHPNAAARATPKPPPGRRRCSR
eukprot:9597187-Lingulodinium_polyedra.AAC.1